MASVVVTLRGNIIEAVYSGKMTMDLVKEGEAKIEALISRTTNAAILYDTLAMRPPDMTLALEMRSFDGRVRPRVLRCATAVSDAMTAFMSKVAFALAREHRVFYGDRERAMAWLQEAVDTAERR